MSAQSVTRNHVGEYYLSGVRETACGFRLDADSSFQFFFSQGALDRFGRGTWKMAGDKLVLNSAPKPVHDYKLIESRKEPGNHLTIRIVDGNEIIVRYVYALINGGGNESTEGMMDSHGYLRLPAQTVDSIELLFQFCPEKSSVFTISQKQHNYFEFRFEPTMMEIFFKDFELAADEEGFAGINPVLQGDSFLYHKSR